MIISCCRETLRAVLDIIYTGKCHLSGVTQGEEVRRAMRLLDLKLPGDFRQERASGGSLDNIMDTPSSSQSSRPEAGAKRKRSEETSSRHSPAKVARTEGPRASPETLLIEMAKLLMPFSENKSLPCNFPGCGEILNHLVMTDHFKIHFREREDHHKPDVIMFRCQHCDKEFKLRRALDGHLKKCSRIVKETKEKSPSKRLDSFSSSSSDEGVRTARKKANINFQLPINIAKERVPANKDLFSDSSSADEKRPEKTNKKSPLKRLPSISSSSVSGPGDNTNAGDETKISYNISSTGDDESEPVTKDARSLTKGKVYVCKWCDEEVKSEWHLHPNRHDCSKKNENIVNEGFSCQHCRTPYSSQFKLKVHEKKCSTKGNLSISKKHDESQSHNISSANSDLTKINDKFTCPKCDKIFSRRGNLKIHLGTKHYKDKLTTIYSGTSCKECEKVLESNEELLKHVSMDHEKLLKYLLGKECLFLPPKRQNKVKQQTILNSFFVDNEGKKSSPTKNLESPNKKYPKKLKMNVPLVGSYQCPKCGQSFSDRGAMKYHVGSTHYLEKLRAAYPGTQCTICDKECGQPSWLLRHLTSSHERVLVYLLGKEGLQLAPSSRQQETKLFKKPEDNEEEDNEPPREDEEEEEAVELYMGETCIICKQAVSNSQNFATRHYFGKHFKEKIMAEDPKAYEEYRCFICGEAPSKESKGPRLSHLCHFSKHPELIKKYLAQDGLKLPVKSLSYFEGENGFRVKKVKVDVKISEAIREKAKLLNVKEDHLSIEDGFLESESDEAQNESEAEEPKLSREELLKCFLCHKDFNNAGGQIALLSHYSRDHYR